MSNITEFLFPAPARRSAGAILRWWEARRLPYNAIVGTVGLISLGATNLLLALPPDGHGEGIPVMGVLVVGFLANVCYLLGPIAEVAIEKLGNGRILPTGPALFRMGLTFSTGLVFLPTLIAGFDWIFRIVRAIL
jgi:hypothetical protein